MSLINSRSGQIWVETVVYTLIGLALIGLVLAILTPKIKEFRDRSIIEQTIESLNVFDSKINDVLDAPGNKRKVEFTLERGRFIVNSSGDTLQFVLDESNVRYSEPGVSLDVGRINITTEALTEKYIITLRLHYPYNITYDGEDNEISSEFTPVSIPYDFFVENRGIVNNKPWIDVSEGN